MKLTNNWQDKWKSLAVILPTVVTIAHAVSLYYIDGGLIPPEYLPIAVIVSSYLGRIIKQEGISDAK